MPPRKFDLPSNFEELNDLALHRYLGQDAISFESKFGQISKHDAEKFRIQYGEIVSGFVNILREGKWEGFQPYGKNDLKLLIADLAGLAWSNFTYDGNANTLSDCFSGEKRILDCDTSTVLFADVLREFGVKCEILGVPGHGFLGAHLPDGDFLYVETILKKEKFDLGFGFYYDASQIPYTVKHYGDSLGFLQRFLDPNDLVISMQIPLDFKHINSWAATTIYLDLLNTVDKEKALTFLAELFTKDENAIAKSDILRGELRALKGNAQRAGDFDSAIRYAEFIVKFSPSASNHAELGEVCLKARKYERAVESFLLAKEEDGTYSLDALTGLVRAYEALGQYEKIIEACSEQKSKLQSGDPYHELPLRQATYFMGEAYLRLKQYGEAISAFNLLILDGHYNNSEKYLNQALIGRAKEYISQGKNKEAISDLTDVLNRFSGSSSLNKEDAAIVKEARELLNSLKQAKIRQVH